MSFELFWKAYPKKVGKGAALKAWNKADPSPALVEDIIKAIGRQSKSEQWQKQGGQFIPMPATWINQTRWEDSLPVRREFLPQKSTFRREQVKDGVSPESHACHPNVARMRAAWEAHKANRETKVPKMSWVRGLLAAANWYEALHVQCPGECCPTCPKCGVQHGPFINPFIEGLMAQHPEECIGWNPYHKGFLLCAACEKTGSGSV